MRLNIIKITVSICLFFAATVSWGQTTREALEKKRIELRNEIRRISELRTSNKKKEKSILTEVQDLNQQIKSTENLIDVTHKQLELLNNKINKNERRIAKFRKELEQLKEDYAGIIKNTYKNRSEQSRLMFLLSSKSFLQAYKRLEYMKQYADFRKEQGESIKLRTADLQRLNESLGNQKEEQQRLLAENRKVQARLQENKKAQQELMATITAKESQFSKEINAKQKAINKIDRQIEEMVKSSIAETNKKSGSSKRDAFELTPESKALAADFVKNKGKLPWPVASGRISMKFGKHPHPIVHNIMINNNGVNIDTEEGGKAKTIFNGTVSEVQVLKGANKAIMVRHGNYISIYDNLSEVYVKKGDVVITGQEIGKIATSKSNGKTTLHFLIFQNTKKMDPEDWIINR
ncbi:murein hydrolase activator EnvC family protein [Zunongwangia sp.]|uniref:murein hydrolase activator EnvC family protein n=1 Tax=Zunongwangia sp. TaxID=1965325 RepID=UPI003AA89212